MANVWHPITKSFKCQNSLSFFICSQPNCCNSCCMLMANMWLTITKGLKCQNSLSLFISCQPCCCNNCCFWMANMCLPIMKSFKYQNYLSLSLFSAVVNHIVALIDTFKWQICDFLLSKALVPRNLDSFFLQ
jgi:hypothetical protein